MKKKIFILTGEPSGDRLASTVISKLKNKNKDIEYLCVGGTHLNLLGIKSIYELKEITYIAFTSLLFNIFKIKKKINETVNKIIEFNPDILFSVDSPDFTLRISQKVKKINPNIKVVHFIAPKVWAWRAGRVKKMKKYLDHILLLFDFEKKYFDKENLKNTFVGHPLLDDESKDNIKIDNLIDHKKKYISLFVGSRESEIKNHAPILFKFIKKMNIKENNFNFVFHSTDKFKNLLLDLLNKQNISNAEVISNDRIKIKFANMINIINNKEIIPELIQKDCNSEEIFKSVYYYLKKPELIDKQLSDVKFTLNNLKSSSSSSEEASKILLNYLT